MPSADLPRQVFVTGAGFTRAFVPGAPLLVDDFDNDGLVERVRGLPKASQLLESERNQHRQGFIDIERLMTRLYELMPYDYYDNAVDEFGFLLAELKRAFLERLSRARESEVAKNDIAAFASYCAANNATCITFNYDDFLDEALWTTGDWNPHWGYGFFCRSSLGAVSIDEKAPGGSTLQLLKLHGSINWWPRLGYSQPFVLDAITHHHSWKGVDRVYPQSLVARHLEAEPVIVPPVLSKSGLVAQPVLRLVWALAFESLATADKVTFVGYSFPPTDPAARTLFSEALRDLPRDGIGVVGLAEDRADRDSLHSDTPGYVRNFYSASPMSGHGCYDAAYSMAWCTSQSAWSRIQNCGEVLNTLDNRSAVSAVTRRLPRTTSLRRFTETPSFFAASA